MVFQIVRWIVGSAVFLALLFLSLQNAEPVTLKFFQLASWQAFEQREGAVEAGAGAGDFNRGSGVVGDVDVGAGQAMEEYRFADIGVADEGDDRGGSVVQGKESQGDGVSGRIGRVDTISILTQGPPPDLAVQPDGFGLKLQRPFQVAAIDGQQDRHLPSGAADGAARC